MIDLQKKLDNKILSERELTAEETMQDRFLAFFTEIAEFTNEWKGFKYWSDNTQSNRPNMLKEYVDILHYLISIGNHFGFIESEVDYEFNPMYECFSVTHQINHIFWLLTDLMATPRKEVYEELVNRIVVLGYMVDFSEKQIIAAYRHKNEVNHIRQAENY